MGDGLNFPHEFGDDRLRRLALAHRSSSAECNDRLEWLGDAVLNCVLSGMLYEKFPDSPSGVLTRARSRLTSNDTLSEIAAELGVPAAVRTSPPELRTNSSVLADALEALFGATFVDAGYRAAEAAVRAVYRERIARIAPDQDFRDAKTRLNELLQSRGLPTAKYCLEDDSGDTKEVSCSVGDREMSRGAGANRALAEQQAASRALEALA